MAKHARRSLATVLQLAIMRVVTNQSVQTAVGLKAQKAVYRALPMLTVMVTVLVSATRTGHRSAPVWSSSAMPTAPYTWESAGPIAAHAPDQTSTIVTPAKNTPTLPTASVLVPLTGLERTAASSMVPVISSATAVWDPDPLAVSTAFLMHTKMTQVSVYANRGIEMPTARTEVMDPGTEIIVPYGVASVPLPVIHAPTDTSPNSARNATRTPSGTNTVSAAVMMTGPATTAQNTSENVTHAATAVMAQATTSVITAPYMPVTTPMNIVSAMKAGQDPTAHSGRVNAATSVMAATIIPQTT